MRDVAATRPSLTTTAAAERTSAFLRSVYGWLFVGLGVTAVVAAGVAGSPAAMRTIASNHLLFLGALGAELALVFYLSAHVQSLTPTAATGLFLVYSALNGVTLSGSCSPIPALPSRRPSSSPLECSARLQRSARRRNAAWPARASSCSWD